MRIFNIGLEDWKGHRKTLPSTWQTTQTLTVMVTLNSQAFAASESYAMELRACHRLNKYMFSVQKRASLEEGLGANLNQSESKYSSWICMVN